MKDYKKSFILSNLFLVGTVLIAMNVLIFVYSYNSGLKELKTTMSQKIEPYDMIRNFLRDMPPENAPDRNLENEKDEIYANAQDEMPEKDDAEPGSGTDNGAADTPDVPPEPKAPVRGRNRTKDSQSDKYSNSVYVFFYNTKEQNVTVISKDKLENNSQLVDTAREIQSESEDFGLLKSEGLYYLRQPAGDEIKIAVVSMRFFVNDMLRLIFVLAAIFALSMLAFYFISLKLANRAAKPLEDAITREKQFVTDASHDLKTPLTVILTNADILNANKQSAVGEMSKWVDGTKKAAMSMKNLVEQMLELSQSESQKQLYTEKVDFSDVAEQNALVMESVAYERNIGYETDIQKGVFVNANADYLKRICSSLIDNALKYENSGGSVKISLCANSKNAVFSVANRTAVIDKEDIAHIFERFYRTDKSRHDESSHGLGLAIVKNFTELMNGKISVSSTKENGTVFTVTFPAL